MDNELRKILENDKLEVLEELMMTSRGRKYWRFYKEDIDQAIIEIKSLLKSKIKQTDKKEWDKVNSLNPDSAEYLNAYEKADTISQVLTEIEKIVDSL